MRDDRERHDGFDGVLAQTAGQHRLAELKQHTRPLLWIAVLAVLAYLPCLWFPFIADDYTQIPMSRVLGPPSGWPELWHNSAFRFRFTYVELSWLVDRAFGFWALPFYVASIGMHVLCSWLVYATGVWKRIGWRVSAAAGAFFAVYEGHQEAVMWVAASMELLLFLSGIGAVVCWMRWVDTRRAAWYVLSLLCFVVALFSKESAVVLPALMAVVAFRLVELIPFGLLSAAVVAVAIGGANARLGDGSFSLHAPFWTVLTNSLWRLLFIWGLLALLWLWRSRRPENTAPIRLAMLWMTIALLPYSFLLYMNRVPSRQTYLASLGLSWLVGAAWLRIGQRRVAAAIAAFVILANVGVLWVRKREQFLERAAPTEELLRVVRQSTTPVKVHCFPYEFSVARSAAESVGKRIEVDAWPSSGPNCLAVTVDGQLLQIHR